MMVKGVADRRMLTKLTPIMGNTSRLRHHTVESLSSSFSSRLLPPQCKIGAVMSTTALSKTLIPLNTLFLRETVCFITFWSKESIQYKLEDSYHNCRISEKVLKSNLGEKK